ncbi:hypothetical protein IFM89_010921 [Coptis chinensis]|uniref:Aldose 1-epimerase n=1 Tax=Coptis chinensis TaxID=261450 RepID=A0A835MDW5_9MAGN|nr:hypothetical protein IFM89_010921 [Coptis chinensis]
MSNLRDERNTLFFIRFIEATCEVRKIVATDAATSNLQFAGEGDVRVNTNAQRFSFSLNCGKIGFGDVIWRVKKFKQDGPAPYITFAYRSANGEQGFPGVVSFIRTYMLYGNQKLSVIMKARALNKATPINLAQHTYWNLGGNNNGDILKNRVQLFAAHITPTNDELIPTGKIDPVKGTPFDFLKQHTIGSRIDKVPKGYDINYAVNGSNDRKLKKVAKVHDPKLGRLMKLWSDQPGVQFYTGNMLKDVKGKGGVVYGPHAALCLETQGFPNAVNHPNFPSVIVNPGKPYTHFMLFQFSTK